MAACAVSLAHRHEAKHEVDCTEVVPRRDPVVRSTLPDRE
jgi:hypothetical protein